MIDRLSCRGVGAASKVCDTCLDTESRERAGRVPAYPEEMS